jgi:hypothetical protein
VSEKWISKLRKSAKGAKLMQIGTKSDLCIEAGVKGVTTEERAALAQQIGAFDCKEGSGRTGMRGRIPKSN